MRKVAAVIAVVVACPLFAALAMVGVRSAFAGASDEPCSERRTTDSSPGSCSSESGVVATGRGYEPGTQEPCTAPDGSCFVTL